ncbi:DUF2330 domain-containing protein [Chondromyces crocatus]|nr:DUF2330 domain-containing protein [Chondromyces crocatus]
MALANGGNVLPRRFALLAFTPLTLAALPGDAHASGAWLPSAGQAPVEQRVAVAVGPSRTTVWTSMRFDGSAGPVGVVIPVPSLSSLDLSSDAWLEALDVATAPRIFPPAGERGTCPADPAAPDAVHVVCDEDPTQTLSPTEITVLEDAGAVALWAAQGGLTLSPGTASALGGVQGKRFVAARFVAPGGAALTRTLRVVLPGVEPVLPLALTQATAGDVLVTAWFIGEGRAALPESMPVSVNEEALTWNAATLESDYEDERMAALVAAGPEGAVLECSSHDALARNVSLGGAVSIEGVVTSYFERAKSYGDGDASSSACTAAAAVALSSSARVSWSCPRAAQGVVDGMDSCVESGAPGEIDPERLRCGAGADDLAVALSGMAGQEARLTRYTLRIPSNQRGVDQPLDFTPGPPVSPVLTADSVSTEDCEGGVSSSSSSSSSTGGSSSGGGTGVPSGGAGGTIFYDETFVPTYMGCGCSGTADTADTTYDDGGCSGDTSDGYEGTESDDGCSGDSSDGYYEEDDGCSGDSSDGYEGTESDDGCSGDSSDGYYEEDDGCSGDSSDGYYEEDDGCSGDSTDSTSSDGCSSDTSDGTSADGCSSTEGGSSSDTSCDSGSSSGSTECSIASAKQGAQKRRGPRLSPMGLGMMAVIAPLRRLLRPRRRGDVAPGARERGTS